MLPQQRSTIGGGSFPCSSTHLSHSPSACATPSLYGHHPLFWGNMNQVGLIMAGMRCALVEHTCHDQTYTCCMSQVYVHGPMQICLWHATYLVVATNCKQCLKHFIVFIIRVSLMVHVHVHVHVYDIWWTHTVWSLCDNCITVDLWDNLLLRMEEEVLGGMQGLQDRGGWSGDSCGVVSWHDDIEEQYEFNKVQWP